MSELTQEQKFKFRYRMEQEAEEATGQPSPTPVAAQPASLADKMVGGWGGRTLMGMASPLLAGAQLLGGETGRTGVAELEAMKQRGMAAEGKEGADVYGAIGSLIPGAGIAKGVSAALPAATGVLGRMGVGAAQGGAIAGATPSSGIEASEYLPKKAEQIGTGTAIGGAVPLVMDAGKKVVDLAKQATQPFTETGRTAILQELRDALMGNDPKVKQTMIQALQQAKPIVPGSQPTAGEALAHLPESTGLAAHQQAVSKLPRVSPLFQQRAAEQEAARSGAIGNIAQTPSALEAAVKARGTEAAQKYGAAFQQTIPPDKLVYPSTYATLMERPSMKKAAMRAMELAQESGEKFDPTSVKSLHYMKMAMDDLIKNPERFSIGAQEGRAMAKTQGEFVQWLGKQSPEYETARASYKAASEPINRMQVGQELEKALRTPLDTSERAGVFAKAAEDAPRTIKRATGQAMFDKLEDVLQPQETSAVKQVAEELARKDAFQRLARGTHVSGIDSIPGRVGLPLPNLLSRPAMIANFVLKHAGEKAQGKIAQVAAEQYLNPQKLADALQDLPWRYRPMIEALMRQAPTVPATAAARQFEGATQ